MEEKFKILSTIHKSQERFSKILNNKSFIKKGKLTRSYSLFYKILPEDVVKHIDYVLKYKNEYFHKQTNIK